MRKRLVAIYSVLIVVIVLLAVLTPSCAPTEKGTIEVKATLCGAPWEGAVNYTLAPASGSPIDGASVSANFSVTAGTWTCNNVSGGPAGAFLDTITASPTQTVAVNQRVTFTLNFEREQDASIDFITWVINGVPIEEYPNAFNQAGNWYADIYHCDVIGVRFTQHVAGCQGYEVAVNETSELRIKYTSGFGAIHVSVGNNACAVVKEPEPIGKVSQVTSFNGEPVQLGEDFELPLDQTQTLGVETAWLLEKERDYTKTIDWLGVSDLPGEHQCILFDLLVPLDGKVYDFDLVASAEVELVDDEDINPENNWAVSFPLHLIVYGSQSS